VLPKPPFACDLPLAPELDEFDRLRPSLAEVWKLYERAIHALDREAALGHAPSGYQWSVTT